MPYILSPQDKQKINFLAAIGGRVLRQLRVPFNSGYLSEKLVLAYHGVFDVSTDGFADRDDAANLAIVLLNALASYHVKNRVVEGGGHGKDEIVLVVLQNGRIKFYEEEEDAEHYILLERSTLSGEPGYQKRFWEKQFQLLLWGACGVSLVGMVGMAVWNGQENLLWIFPMAVVMAGLYVGYHLFQLEKNSIKSKFCGSNKAFDCSTVLNSKGAKIAGVLSMTDVGIVYFSSVFIFLIYNLISKSYTGNIGVFLLISIVPLPYVCFSVYYQLKVIKKICLLCLITQGLLVSQFVFFALVDFNFTVSLEAIAVLFLIVLFIAVLYFFIVRWHKQKAELTRLQVESYMQRNDEEFFSLMLRREPIYAEPYLDGLIQLGNPEAEVKLTAFLSLSCKPCAKMLDILIKMTDWFTDQISITIMPMADEPSQELLQAIYYYTLKNDQEAALAVLKNNHPPKGFANDNRTACRNVLYQHGRWLQNHYVPYTPTVLFEGHALPAAWHEEGLMRNIIARELDKIAVEQQ